MKKMVKRRTFWLTAAALVLLGSVSVHQAMAYFTTYVTAKGGYPVTLGSSTSIEEKVEDMTKHIVLSNTGESECYVRVKIFSGSQIDMSCSTSTDDGGNPYWSLNEADGYWYYKNILPVGGKTEELLAAITIPEEFKDSFDVIVVQECTPVSYQEDGTPYADWEKELDTRTDIGTAGGEEDD